MCINKKHLTDDKLKPDFSEVGLGLCKERQVNNKQYQDEGNVKTHQPLSYW